MKPKIYFKLLPKSIKGIYDCRNNEPIIIINTLLSDIEKRCTFFEELFHHHYFPDCNFFECKTYFELCLCREKENKVKRKLAISLVPLKILKQKVLPFLDIYPLIVLADDLNVTEEILKLRLEIYIHELYNDRF